MRYAAGALCLLLLSSTALADGRIDLTLKPITQEGLVSAIDVNMRYDVQGGMGPLILPEYLGPLFHIADRIETVTAHDDAGALPMTMSSGERHTDDATPLGNKIRIWTPDRPTQGTIVVDYRALVSHEPLPGPSWEVRAEPRGVSAAGNTFLLLPDDKRDYTVKLTWDLAELPAGAKTITSLPPDVATKPITAERLRDTYFMAGQLQTTPDDGGTFRAASTADTPYSQSELLGFSAEAYKKMLGLFGPPLHPNFTVMFRGSKISAISGTELPDALMATMRADTPLADVERLASHEMVHVFMGGLDPESWFEEGLAVIYQHRAPFITGMIGPDSYIEDVNSIARTYYSNVRYNMPMKEAEQSFWSDARARLQPYMRGGMYFSMVDAKLKAKTAGKRGLDAVMREFIADRNAGKSVTVDDWLNLVARDLGPEARADYEAMMSGKRIMLPSNAFGPCFQRKTERMPVFELGFAIGSLMKQPRIISGLDPASPAARAGLREGDKVTAATPLDNAQETPEKEMSLTVERDGKPIEIRFKPAGKQIVDGFQWVRVKGIPDDRCRI